MTAPVTVQWFAARTAGRETRAALYLTRAGFEPFRPVIHRYFWDKRRRAEKFRIISLFPGYIFFAARGRDHATHARNVTGISGILGEYLGDTFAPKAMPGAYIGELLDKCPIIEGKRKKFCTGDRVEIAVAGISKVIAEVESHSGNKVRVFANVLGNKTIVTVDESLVEASE